MKGNRIGNICHVPIKFIYYAVTEFKLKIAPNLFEKRIDSGVGGGLQLRLSYHNWVIRIRNTAH